MTNSASHPGSSLSGGLSTRAATPVTPALQGALLAFNKAKPAPPKPKPQRLRTNLTPEPDHPGSSLAGSPISPGRTRTSRPETRAGSRADGDEEARSVTRSSHDSPARGHPSRLSPFPTGPAAGSLGGRGTSFIAATLAHSRSTSPVPAKPVSPARTGPAGVRAGRVLERTDSTTLRPAAALISMFEGAAGDPVKADGPKTQRRAKTPADSPIVAKIVQRPVSRVEKIGDVAAVTVTSVGTPRESSVGVARESALGEETPVRLKPPTPPKPRKSTTNPITSVSAMTSTSTTTPTKTTTTTKVTRPVDSKSAENTRAGFGLLTRHDTTTTTSSDDTFVSASSAPTHNSPPASPSRSQLHLPPPVREPRPSPSPTPKPLPSTPQAKTPSRPTSTLPLTPLSNAMLASSLAASRVSPHPTGESPSAPLPKPTPSPRMLATLRPEEKPKHHRHHLHRRAHDSRESDEDKQSRHRRKKRSRFRGKKHVHNEGARKRWRDYISEPQRRRYEAVWASNRDALLHLDPRFNPSAPHGSYDPSKIRSQSGSADASGEQAAAAGYVVNLVVRELWRRSRLPDDELEEVWDLVDTQRRGVLGRREFVVGMWLIDQRLRGRKIPARVGQSVWDSASGMVRRK